ncbi:MAG TPA: hypothetical protein VGP72_14855 [Planctomycetota bacterium]|jgi:hypothetical protein
MTNTRFNSKLAILALLLALPLVLQTRTASAANWGVSFGLGWHRPAPVVFAPPVVERDWVPEHYETRMEQVLVEAGHYEKQWVSDTREFRRDRWGHGYSTARSGYWTEVYVPARYETRTVSVLVPGYYRDVAAPCMPAPRIAFGYRHR